MVMKVNAQCWPEIKPEIIPYQFSGKEEITHHGALKKICTIAIKQFERKLRVYFLWKQWAVWNNNLTMWMGMVRPLKVFLPRWHQPISPLPSHQQGLVWSHTVTPAVVAHCGHQKELETTSGREASPMAAFPKHLPNLFQPPWNSIPTVLCPFFLLTHVLFEVSKWPGTLAKALLFREQWKDYFRWPILKTLTPSPQCHFAIH